MLYLFLAACSQHDTQPISRQALLGEQGSETSTASAAELVRFRYTSYPGGRVDGLNVSFSMDEDSLDYEVCQPQGGGAYEATEYSCPILKKGVMALSAAEAKRLRALLILARPTKLSEDGPFLLPHGCSFVFHGRPVYSVNYSDGVKFGAFLVQQGTECEGMKEARRYIGAIISSLPDPSIVKEYPVYWQSEDS